MSIRSILVHVDNDAQCAQRIHLACALARRHQAHVTGIATSGLSRFLYASLPAEQSDPTLALHLRLLREQADGALAAFLRICQDDPPPSVEACLIDDEAGAALAMHAHTADLVVLSHGHDGPHGDDLAPYVVMHAVRPVLLLPPTTPPQCALQQPLVAWDASREAARAMQLALPLLQQARVVHIATIDTGRSAQATLDARTLDPGGWLRRHGVMTEQVQRTLAGLRHGRHGHLVGNALLALAAEYHSDFLVMGGYGHSRMRETILGGVTRTVLEEMTLPVLMAH